MGSAIALPKLTDQQKKFVQLVASGMAQTSAARQAGYKFASVEGYQLMRNPKIAEAIRVEQGKYEHASNMSRKKVLDGLLEAVDIARTMAEPSSMVAAWREVAKICGYYAPEQKKIDISVSGAVTVAQIENLSDDELVKVILEGESQRLSDIDDPDDEVPALPAPQEDLGVDDGRDPDEA